jgi:hypothetical protein
MTHRAQAGVVTTIIPPTPTLAPPPAQAFLNSPPYEKQTANNCGPAALSMMLHMFGWNGSQKDISDVIKPVNGDRNVNPEEMAFWVRNYAGWLRIEYRVGGDLETLKRLLAAAYPVIVESTTALNREDSGWADDDLWAAHYLLLTGYDDAAQTFTAQDTYRGPDKTIPYAQLESEWKPFNYVYLIVYLPEQEEAIKTILGSNWDADLNRQRALELAQAATAADASDSRSPWFSTWGATSSTSNATMKPTPRTTPRANSVCPSGCSAINSVRSLPTSTRIETTICSRSRSTRSNAPKCPKRPGSGAAGRSIAMAISTARSKHGAKRYRFAPGYEDALYALNFVGSTP